VESSQGRVIILMGPPNAGKDTQAFRLAEYMGGIHIGSGELLRREADPRVMEVMAKGELVSSDDFRRLVGHAIEKVPTIKPVVLAGIAKKPEEAHWIVEYLPTIGRRIDKVILLNITMDEAKRRSVERPGDRADDSPRVQELRWQRYFEMTKQSLEFFRGMGLLEEVDAQGSRAEVARRVDQAAGL